MIPILNLIVNNWRKFALISLIIILGIYYSYSKVIITKLRANLILANTQILKQQQEYQILSSQSLLKESAIETLNIQLNIAQFNYESSQDAIKKYKDNLNNTNVITKQWMRLALGLAAEKLPSLSSSAESSNGKDDTSGLVLPSDAAEGINEYRFQCQKLKIKDDELIDYIIKSSVNYNKYLN